MRNWVELELGQLWEGSHSATGMKQAGMGTFEHLCPFVSVLSSLTDSGELEDQIPANKELMEEKQTGIIKEHFHAKL